MKSLVWIGIFVGSTIGSYIPTLWGSSAYSFVGLVCSLAGGLTGAWLGWRWQNS